MKRRSKVVLYNPKAVFYTFPLALLALGSALDRERFEVVIVDGRLDPDRLQEEIRDASVLGVTVLTGDPIRDALRASRRAKEIRPDLPIAWGGWHASLFPEETLEEDCIDVTVQGQGELTFREIVQRLACLDVFQPDGVDGIFFGKVLQNHLHLLSGRKT